MKEAGTFAQDLDIDLIVSSPRTRAIESARIIARAINYSFNQILTSELLRERDFGILEGRPWSPNLSLQAVRGAETIDELLARSRRAADWLVDLDATNVLVVSHGFFGRGLRAQFPAGPIPEDKSHAGTADELPNGRIICLWRSSEREARPVPTGLTKQLQLNDVATYGFTITHEIGD